MLSHKELILIHSFCFLFRLFTLNLNIIMSSFQSAISFWFFEIWASLNVWDSYREIGVENISNLEPPRKRAKLGTENEVINLSKGTF